MNRVRTATNELMEAARDLIETTPPKQVQGLFDRVFPGDDSTLTERAARLSLFNGIVGLLSTRLRQELATKHGGKK